MPKVTSQQQQKKKHLNNSSYSSIPPQLIWFIYTDPERPAKPTL